MNILALLLHQIRNVRVTEHAEIEISIASASAIVRAAGSANPRLQNTARTVPVTTTDHEVENGTEIETESGRRIAIVIVIVTGTGTVSTDTAILATIPKKALSENDPKHPTRKRNFSKLPSKKLTHPVDPQ